MRVLVVAMIDSVHTARWLSMIAGQGWDVHLYPSYDLVPAHAALRDLALHRTFYHRRGSLDRSVRQCGIPLPLGKAVGPITRLLARLRPDYHVRGLARVIRRVQPDVIHSLEFQGAGYLTLEARRRLGARFPPWIATNWGSDIYLFARLKAHSERVRKVLRACDFYQCECHRDVRLAQALGFAGEVLPVIPVAGGFDLLSAAQLRQPGPTSERRLIMVKGYQHWAGRALFALRAISLCADALRGYRVRVYGANAEVAMAVELLAHSKGIAIEVVPPCAHDELLRLFGQARIYLGLSISDAISTSLLEALVMGTFPIQSCTSCADEWVRDGESGLIVPPEDPLAVAAAIRRALADDKLVDEASALNDRVARERLDEAVVRPQVVAMYKTAAALHSGATE